MRGSCGGVLLKKTKDSYYWQHSDHIFLCILLKACGLVVLLVPGSIFRSGYCLCMFCMFSLCPGGYPLNILVSSHLTKNMLVGELEDVWGGVGVCEMLNNVHASWAVPMSSCFGEFKIVDRSPLSPLNPC